MLARAAVAATRAAFWRGSRRQAIAYACCCRYSGEAYCGKRLRHTEEEARTRVLQKMRVITAGTGQAVGWQRGRRRSEAAGDDVVVNEWSRGNPNGYAPPCPLRDGVYTTRNAREENSERVARHGGGVVAARVPAVVAVRKR